MNPYENASNGDLWRSIESKLDDLVSDNVMSPASSFRLRKIIEQLVENARKEASNDR
jgi:hypothetical protein